MNPAGIPEGAPDKEQESRKPSSRRVDLRLVLVAAGIGGLSWLVFWATAPDAPQTAEKQESLKALNLSGGSAGIEGALRPELARALDSAEGVPRTERLLLLRSLGDDLMDEEREALLVVLSKPRPAWAPAGWYSEYVHEICLALNRQDAGHERFARVLGTVAADARRDGVVRDYALQHLRRVWERSEDIGGLRGSIETTFAELAAGDPVLSASALLSLHLLGSGREDGSGDLRAQVGETTYHTPDSRLEPVVSNILDAEPTAEGLKSRMTALRIVSDRRLAAFRPRLRQVASDGREHALARMAAIAAIARFGDRADHAFVESLDRGDPRIDGAVGRALARLR